MDIRSRIPSMLGSHRPQDKRPPQEEHKVHEEDLRRHDLQHEGREIVHPPIHLQGRIQTGYREDNVPDRIEWSGGEGSIQGIGFDCPDRLFINLQNSISSSISEKGDFLIFFLDYKTLNLASIIFILIMSITFCLLIHLIIGHHIQLIQENLLLTLKLALYKRTFPEE